MPDLSDNVEEPQLDSFFGNILEPGSSFDPRFLLIVDGAFASLFAVLVALAVLTRGNVHLIFLTFVELALWASVKWFVHEWNLVQVNATPPEGVKSKQD